MNLNSTPMRWAPAVVLLLGIGLSWQGGMQQRSVPLRAPLDSVVPRSIAGAAGSDVVIDEAEQAVAGMDQYVMRVYQPAGMPDAAAFSVYVGYYERQEQGKTIHSPKNCMPGAGWEPLVSSRETVKTAMGDVPVNRYVLQNGAQKALVLYWYQGRGRVAANEYQVKWDLLRDQALRGRSDEALVRVIVPIEGDEKRADELAAELARTLVPAVNHALPS